MVSIKRILCPIDFSDHSRHAWNRAGGIAQEHGARLVALHVIQADPGSTETEVTFTGPLLVALREFTSEAAAKGLSVENLVMRAPAVPDEILAQASRIDADLIVMGTHGRTGFKRLLLGSITERVVRTAHQPVLTVGTHDATAAASFRRILCAVDFSECSIAALRYAIALAEGAGARLTVLNVVELAPVGYDPLIGPAVDFAGYQQAAEAINRDRLHIEVMAVAPGTTAIEELVTVGRPHHQILHVAEAQGSDLIVLGIHGKNPIERTLFGSTAEPLVHRAECPVLTVRPGALRTVAAA